MEHFYRDVLEVDVGWGTNSKGEYHADYARQAWKAWQAAQIPMKPGIEDQLSALKTVMQVVRHWRNR